jgi:hypothetical protein
MKADVRYYRTEGEIALGHLMLFICLAAGLFTLVLLYVTADRADAPVADLPDYKMEPTTTITARP